MTASTDSLISFFSVWLLSTLGNPNIRKVEPKIGILNSSDLVKNLIDTGRQ